MFAQRRPSSTKLQILFVIQGVSENICEIKKCPTLEMLAGFMTKINAGKGWGRPQPSLSIKQLSLSPNQATLLTKQLPLSIRTGHLSPLREALHSQAGAVSD